MRTIENDGIAEIGKHSLRSGGKADTGAVSPSVTSPRLSSVPGDGSSRKSRPRTAEFFQVLHSRCCNSQGKWRKVPVTVSSAGEEICARLGADRAGGLVNIYSPARFFPSLVLRENT